MATSSIFANIVLRTEAEVSALCEAYEQSLRREQIEGSRPKIVEDSTCGAAKRYLERLKKAAS